MCGIGGIFLKDGFKYNLKIPLNRIIKIQHHRGPDANGYWIDNNKNIGLCHNRLSILDLSEAGNQPMSSSDQNYTISFNGEIYNFIELKNQLIENGVIFKTKTDTEILIEGYRYWGAEVLKLLRGMFAFAIYDKRKNELFCARDHIGKKPFVYTEADNLFVFASEIPAVKSVEGVSNEISINSISAILLHNMRHIPDPHTVYSKIKRLRPGHALIVKNGEIKKYWRYWNPYDDNLKVDINYNDLRSIIDESVTVRLIADVPIGALLSGGIDSSAIVNLMRQKSTNEINTYAFGFDKEDEDIKRAAYVSRIIGTNHHEFFYDKTDQLNIFKNIIKTYGEPIMLLPMIHAYEMSKKINDSGIKVILNGNGADELFFGYIGHIRTAKISNILNRINLIRKFIPQVVRDLSKGLLEDIGSRKAKYYEVLKGKYWEGIINTSKLNKIKNITSQEMQYWGNIFQSKDYIDEANYISLFVDNTHSVTTIGDLPAMMASVEMRSPFLDKKVISAAINIHYSKKVKSNLNDNGLKYILRKSLNDLLPDRIINAPKRGFGYGIQEKDVMSKHWFNEVNDVLTNFTDPLDIFDSNYIQNYWLKCLSNKNKADWSLLSKLFCIGLWFRETK